MNLPSLRQRIEQLIATPSISSTSPALDQSNERIIHLLAQWLEDLGFVVQLMPLPGQKWNLIATLGSGSNGLVLSGHTDTVPFDEQRWSHDPFQLTEKNHRLYGLGTSDMKAFFAFALEAATQYVAKDLKAPLILVATADEETTMAGAQALLDSGTLNARHAVIGEPTNLKPVRLHKGIMMEKIHLLGRSGHSSDPSLGHNAIEGMTTVLAALKRWRAQLQQRYQNDLFVIPYPTLNFGHIHGGDNPNRICGECELHIDLRPLPGMGLESLREALQDTLQNALLETPYEVTTAPLFSGIPAMETAAVADIVQAAEQLTGANAGSVAYATEAPFFNRMGMDTVILGPGSIDLAHQPDEYLDMAQMRPTVQLLRQLIERFCL